MKITTCFLMALAATIPAFGERPPQAPPVDPRFNTITETTPLANVIESVSSLRQDYVRDVEGLRGVATAMRHEGFSSEDIAIAVHAMRRHLGIKYKDLTPADLREKILARNLEKYGDKFGPSVAFLRARGESWDAIIDSACKTGGEDISYLFTGSSTADDLDCPTCNLSNRRKSKTVTNATTEACTSGSCGSYSQSYESVRYSERPAKRGWFGKLKFKGACGKCN